MSVSHEFVPFGRFLQWVCPQKSTKEYKSVWRIFLVFPVSVSHGCDNDDDDDNDDNIDNDNDDDNNDDNDDDDDNDNDDDNGGEWPKVRRAPATRRS